MKKYFPFFLLLLSFGCSKTENKVEEPKVNDIQLSSGQGALFVGSTVQGKSYDLVLKMNGKTFTGFVQGRSNNKALKNCTYSDGSFGHTFKVDPGKYTLEIKNPSVSGEEPSVISIEIQAGKCQSLNVDGHAW